MVTSPSSISFGSVGKKETAEKDFDLTISNPDKIKVKGISATDERFEVALKEGDPAKKATYTVKFKGHDALERISGKIQIELEGSDASPVEMPVRARVVGNLKYPGAVYISKRNDEFKTREVKLESRNGEPITLLSIEDPDKNLAFKTEKKKGSEIIAVASVADPEKDYSTSVRGKVIVKTDDPDEPEVSLRYTISAGRGRRPDGAKDRFIHSMKKGSGFKRSLIRQQQAREKTEVKAKKK